MTEACLKRSRSLRRSAEVFIGTQSTSIEPTPMRQRWIANRHGAGRRRGVNGSQRQGFNQAVASSDCRWCNLLMFTELASLSGDAEGSASEEAPPERNLWRLSGRVIQRALHGGLPAEAALYLVLVSARKFLCTDHASCRSEAPLMGARQQGGVGKGTWFSHRGILCAGVALAQEQAHESLDSSTARICGSPVGLTRVGVHGSLRKSSCDRVQRDRLGTSRATSVIRAELCGFVRWRPGFGPVAGCSPEAVVVSADRALEASFDPRLMRCCSIHDMNMNRYICRMGFCNLPIL